MASDQKPNIDELADADRAEQIRALLASDPLPMIQASVDAFRRDLPELLRNHRRMWVAYNGDQRVAIGRYPMELYKTCFQRGLTRDEFIVCGIEEGVFDPEESIEASWDF